MSQELWTKDWKKINDIILQMNSENDILKALNTFLVDIEGLVPYEKACIYFYDLSARLILSSITSVRASATRSSRTTSVTTATSMTLWTR